MKKKTAANVPKTKASTNIHYQARKQLQTSNKSVLGFSLYIMYSHTYLIKKTAAKVIFRGCKGAKVGKT